MHELTRISISLESSLLDAFDKSIAAKSYPTRSEAIRDLIRDRLIREEAERVEGEQVAVVTLVYDHHARELAARLIDKQHHHHDLVVSSLHVHLGERHCLEVSVLRGPAAKVRHLGDELLATKGVLHGEITFTGGEVGFNRLALSRPVRLALPGGRLAAIVPLRGNLDRSRGAMERSRR